MRNLLLIMSMLFSISVLSQEQKTYVRDFDNNIVYTKTSETGIILEEGTYNENGKHIGIWKQYDKSGNLLVIGKFKNGVKHGVWKHYLDNDYVEVTYSNGLKSRAKIITDINFLVATKD